MNLERLLIFIVVVFVLLFAVWYLTQLVHGHG